MEALGPGYFIFLQIICLPRNPLLRFRNIVFRDQIAISNLLIILKIVRSIPRVSSTATRQVEALGMGYFFLQMMSVNSSPIPQSSIGRKLCSSVRVAKLAGSVSRILHRTKRLGTITAASGDHEYVAWIMRSIKVQGANATVSFVASIAQLVRA